MPKNFSFLRNSHSSAGRSARSTARSQALHMEIAWVHWLSTKACSFSDRPVLRLISRLCQSGRPVNSSPSQLTVPASRATFSVSDTLGATFLNMANTRGVSQLRRNPGRPAAAVTAAPINSMSASNPDARNSESTPVTTITPMAGLAPDSLRITTRRPVTAARNSMKVIMDTLCCPWF